MTWSYVAFQTASDARLRLLKAVENSGLKLRKKVEFIQGKQWKFDTGHIRRGNLWKGGLKGGTIQWLKNWVGHF